MKSVLIFLVVVFGAWFFLFRSDAVTLGPGVTVSSLPGQHNDDLPEPFAFNEYEITPLARFELTAKVLSRETYSRGRESDLSPLDLALGWGPMSDEAVLDKIDISQSGRWYRWKTANYPIPRRDIETHSANMHLIPADDDVEDSMMSAVRGELVEFSGYLIRADADDGWHWVSSLTRNDTGAHACEVVFVESFYIISPD